MVRSVLIFLLFVFAIACRNTENNFLASKGTIATDTKILSGSNSIELDNKQFIRHEKDSTLSSNIFKLTFSSVALGPGFLDMQPVFRVIDKKFAYTSEQTGYYEGQEIQKPQPISSGKFRTSSIDSIISLVSGIKDSLVFRDNIHIIDGGIDYISISKDKIKIEFELMNASDPIAQKIVNILNSYIDNENNKLSLRDIQ